VRYYCKTVPNFSGATYGIGRARLNPSTVEMRMCVSAWMKFITAYKGSLGYDYNYGDRLRPRLTAEDVRRQVALLLSCEDDDWQYDRENDGDDSESDDVEVASGDLSHT